jgi:hypothetical protein
MKNWYEKLFETEVFLPHRQVRTTLKSLGFRSVEISGAKLGAISRSDKLTTEDFEMLVVAEKQDS